MRVLFYGDTQVHSRDATYLRFLRDTMRFLCYVVKERRPQYLIHLGDVYDTNGHIDAPALLFGWDWFRAVSDCVREVGGEHIMLLGNHDIGGGSKQDTFMRIFEGHATVVVEPTITASGIGLLPYMRDPEEVKRGLEYVGSTGLVASHVEWIGPRLTPKRASTHGLDPAEVRRKYPNTVFVNGHYHTPQIVAPAYFVGSPLEGTWGDSTEGDMPRGFAWLENGELTQIENPHSPRHRVIDIKSRDAIAPALDLLRARGSIDSTRLRVVCPSELIEEVNEVFAGALTLRVVPPANDVDEQQVFADARKIARLDVETALAAMQKLAPPEYDAELLAEIGRKLFDEGR